MAKLISRIQNIKFYLVRLIKLRHDTQAPDNNMKITEKESEFKRFEETITLICGSLSCEANSFQQNNLVCKY